MGSVRWKVQDINSHTSHHNSVNSQTDRQQWLDEKGTKGWKQGRVMAKNYNNQISCNKQVIPKVSGRMVDFNNSNYFLIKFIYNSIIFSLGLPYYLSLLPCT